MERLQLVKTNLRIYRGIMTSAGVVSQLEETARRILHAQDVGELHSPQIPGASLLRSSAFAKARRHSEDLQLCTLEFVENKIDAMLPASSYSSLLVQTAEAHVIHRQDQPFRYDLALGFENKTFDDERNAVYLGLGDLACEDVLIEDYTEIRLGSTRQPIPSRAVDLLNCYLPRMIELEPVEFAFFQTCPTENN